MILIKHTNNHPNDSFASSGKLNPMQYDGINLKQFIPYLDSAHDTSAVNITEGAPISCPQIKQSCITGWTSELICIRTFHANSLCPGNCSGLRYTIEIQENTFCVTCNEKFNLLVKLYKICKGNE